VSIYREAMSKPHIALVAVALALVVAAPAGASTPAQQLRAQKVKYAKLQGQFAKLLKADAAKIATLNGQVVTLKGQVTAQSQGGLAAVLAGTPDDMWAAVTALWTAFPKEPDTAFCGYDKSNTAFTIGSTTSTSWTFTSEPCAMTPG
jgi:hypothetical protein